MKIEVIKIKNNKLVLVFILLLTISLFITGCETKEKISINNIKKEMEKKGYTTAKTINELARVEQAKTGYIFTSKKNKYKIEYYNYQNQENAKKKYDIIYSIYESYGDDKLEDDSSNDENSERYEILTSENYSVISRINNSVIYASVPKKHKTEVKELFDSFEE